MPPKRKVPAAAGKDGKAAAGKDGKAGIMPPKKPMKGKKTPIMKYKRYIHKVMNQVRPALLLSQKSMMIMNNFVVHNFQKIAKEASVLASYSKKKTITIKELKAAVELALPHQLVEYAHRDGNNAVRAFEDESSARKTQGRKRGRGQQA